MNFLAHCALADDAARAWGCGPDQRLGLLAGAVIGDFVKGPIPDHWPTPLRAGTRLHRKIDALSNVHPVIRANCDRYPGHLRRLAPIFVDLVADHCLAQRWQDFYAVELSRFSDECYDAIGEFEDNLGADGRRFVGYMRETDLLANYHQWRHVERGLASVLRRLDRPQMLRQVSRASAAQVSDTHQDLDRFYPQLRDAWQQWNAFDVIAAPRS